MLKDRVISAPGGPVRLLVPDSLPEPEWADREHQKTLHDEQDLDPTAPQFTIRTNMPMKCLLRCSAPLITMGDPFMIVNVPDQGAVFMHLHCLGINTEPAAMDDANYVAHIKRKFTDQFMTDKLYGRRTVD